MNVTHKWRLSHSSGRGILALSCCAFLLVGAAATPLAVAQEQQRLPTVKLKRYHPGTPSRGERQRWLQRSVAVQSLGGVAQAAVSDPLQIDHWFFSVTSSRDGNQYQGVIVGSPALSGGGVLTTTPVQVIPVVVNTESVGIGVIGFSTVLTTPGVRTFDPAAADPACLTSSPTKVPLKIFKKSPLFKNAAFNFGGVDVGFTQFGDAIQRAQFWNTIDPATYHVRLGPLSQPAPLILNVPAPGNGTGGLALDPTVFGLCGPMAIVDINLIDSFVIGQFAALTAEGVSPSTFPIFVFYNTGFALGDPTDLFNCCAGGYHNAVAATDPSFVQTYAVADFDTTGAFGLGFLDTAVASHEVLEWMNDPLGTNPTPSWGNVGQQSGCQSNLEIADPLSGTESPRIFMPIPKFTYHLQEQAFFSWFFGAVDGGPPSIGVNAWFSSNGSFLSDAGPPCS